MPQAAENFSKNYMKTLEAEELPKPVNDRSSHPLDHSIEHLRKRIKSVRLERLMAQQLEAELEIEECQPGADQAAMAEVEGRAFEREIGELAQKMIGDTPASVDGQIAQSDPSARHNSGRIREGIEIASLLASKTAALTEFLDRFDREFSDLEETQRKLELLEEKYIALVEEQESRAGIVAEQKEQIKFLELRLKNIMSVLDATRESMQYLEDLAERRNREASSYRQQLAAFAAADKTA